MQNSKVLALKYRPVTLDDLVGQEAVAKTIFNSIVSTPSDFTFASIEKSFLSFQIKVISELSIADDLPPCIVEIMLNVPVNYIMKNDEKNIILWMQN